jgi:transposase InsO family protein
MIVVSVTARFSLFSWCRTNIACGSRQLICTGKRSCRNSVELKTDASTSARARARQLRGARIGAEARLSADATCFIAVHLKQASKLRLCGQITKALVSPLFRLSIERLFKLERGEAYFLRFYIFCFDFLALKWFYKNKRNFRTTSFCML